MGAPTFLTAAGWPALHTGRLPTGSGWLALLLPILLTALMRLLTLVLHSCLLRAAGNARKSPPMLGGDGSLPAAGRAAVSTV
jgi:hypothetical protein